MTDVYAPDLCIYHGNCADGFTAAWAVYRRFEGAVQFLPGVYGRQINDDVVLGRHVLLVDFSFKKEELKRIAQIAASVTIIDHHKSAAEDLKDFIVSEALMDLTPAEYAELCHFAGRLPIRALFDMDRSGAGMTWDFFHRDTPRMKIIDYVEDRDLWRFDQEGSREVSAYIFAHDYRFDNWDALAGEIEIDLPTVIAAGAAIEKKHHKDIGELLRQTQREMIIGGYRVPVANMPYTLASDAANKMASTPRADGTLPAFAACYFDNNAGKRAFSLRAIDGGADVSQIASQYGGGGHAKAAGFSADQGWEGEGDEAYDAWLKTRVAASIAELEAGKGIPGELVEAEFAKRRAGTA
ncbi:phosphohydrolase [Caulobacter phage phiCbK]|uniref:DHH phosphoesterase protein n=5 Tax=Viruses TaxID=10239 RepID=J3SMP4_9CAUD|nr:DHH phosphoesterase [Caulobacter phage phiCbK]AFO71775.1 phosphohydrolase [Caulobacter phage phiCbK]AFU86892.1 putative DHH phosphoesterase protein [Caulobacter phage phiCbK]ARB14979.1 3'-to-5' oligoribonuclease A [Caulobacter phage Ccr32]ARB15310.1 3'-to-5' oligoribonuclease A [Caulobacter phage Ccr34]